MMEETKKFEKEREALLSSPKNGYDRLSAEDEKAMAGFFDTTRVGVLVNDMMNTRLQMEKQEALEVLDEKLVGQVLRATVREVQATRLFVVLNNVKTEHKYRADVMKCDVDEAVRKQLQELIATRMAPQAQKVRADIEATCFSIQGVDGLRAAMVGVACGGEG